MWMRIERLCGTNPHWFYLWTNLVPRASFPLTSGRKTRALGASISGMRHRDHTYRLRTAHACAVKPNMQNSVISIVIWKWMLPELSFSDRWSRGTKLWERDCLWTPFLSQSTHAPWDRKSQNLGLLKWIIPELRVLALTKRHVGSGNEIKKSGYLWR